MVIYYLYLSLFGILIENVSTKGDGEDLRLLPDARGLYLLQLDVARHGIKLTCWHENDHPQKTFRHQVQIMYYAGYRVLPEAPLREHWVQVINAIFDRTRIMVIRMIIIMAIQNLTSYFVHIVNFLPYSHQQLWMECLLQSQCLSIPLSTLRPLPW